MSKLTNRFNLPPQIVTAILRDPYHSGSDISATSLIQPPRIFQLRKRYTADIEEDASDRIFALLGQVAHKILERSDDHGAFHEERIRVMVNGWSLSAATDIYATKDVSDWVYSPAAGQTGNPVKSTWEPVYVDIPPTIRDHKLTSVAAARFPHPEWELQLNVCAFLWREQGFPVSKLEITAIYRDWKKAEAMRDHRYPPPAQKFEQKLWSHDEQRVYVHDRVRLHKTAEGLPDELLPFCTPDDQWRRKASWAVMSPTAKKAKKICGSQGMAEAYIEGVKGGKNLYTEFRPAEATRCEHWCDVKPFCNQYALEHMRKDKAA
jgi:hypothetical protein